MGLKSPQPTQSLLDRLGRHHSLLETLLFDLINPFWQEEEPEVWAVMRSSDVRVSIPGCCCHPRKCIKSSETVLACTFTPRTSDLIILG